MIKSILISNRGEIALRILRTAKKTGYKVVAVYSEQDKDAAHVKQADQAIFLPGNTLAETYLNIPAIIAAAKAACVDAIHPGYGFLSENPLFAEACEKEGIIFIGPSSESIRAMGNKISAREIAIKHGVPITPGITGSAEELLKNNASVGFPLLIKAAAGGGGKGMRIVRSEADMDAALKSTASEATNYFGDGTIYIERFFDSPRHIEVQVIGDKFGNIVHLFERECSVQRRHQKIIEEAPSPTLSPEVRGKICDAAIRLASSIGYYNAGTIEFLVDDDQNFYFLEMNTRIQVEHPVTEYITGIDIVKEQFNIAEGNKLPFTQNEISINGHAVEVRVYAEDPLNNFMPSPGEILQYSHPSLQNYSGELRIDDARFENNSKVYSNFDPMLSKVIAHGENRIDTITRLSDFLVHYSILGIRTNISYLQVLLNHPDFLANTIHTRYIDNNNDQLIKAYNITRESINKIIPFSAGLLYSMNPPDLHKHNIWEELGYWRMVRNLTAYLDNEPISLTIDKKETNLLNFTRDGIYTETSIIKSDSGFNLSVNGELHQVYMVSSKNNTLLIKYNGFEFLFERRDVAADDSITLNSVVINTEDVGDMISPMPGRVLSIKVSEGAVVEKGDLLMIIEAMKMENNILAPYPGTIDKILVKEGSNVDTTSHLIHLTKKDN